MLKCQELGFSSYRVGGAWQQSLRSRRQTRINQLRKVRGTINHGLLCLGDTGWFYTNCCLSWPLKKKTTTTTWVTRLLRSHSKVKSSCFLSCRSLAHRYSCDLWIAHWNGGYHKYFTEQKNKKKSPCSLRGYFDRARGRCKRNNYYLVYKLSPRRPVTGVLISSCPPPPLPILSAPCSGE